MRQGRHLYPRKKPLKNRAENTFLSYANEKDIYVTKRGWPDFFCWKGNKFWVVEVKRKSSTQLYGAQREIMRRLARHGVKCYVYYADGRKFKQIAPTKSMEQLLAALLSKNTRAIRKAARGVLRSAFDHLYYSEKYTPDDSDGEATSTLLVAVAEIE